MRILVTGGSGFIGNCFVKLLLEKYPSYQIINLDKLTYAGNRDNLRDVEHDPRYTFVQGDICDPHLVNKLCQEVDWVVNFAAETHVDRSIVSSDSFVRTDIFGMYVLLEAVKRHNVKKFLHISTDEVYGDILEGSFKETDRMLPSSPYSASKAAAEMLALSYLRTHTIPLLITRSSNNYGPYQHPEKLIPCFATRLLQGKKVPLHNPTPIRDWIYVQDNCEAVDFVLHQGVIGEVYNIGGNNERTNLEVTQEILRALGKDSSWIERVSDRKGQDMRYSLDCSKIHTLGWRPKISFQAGIEHTIEWYKTHPTWWNKINKIVIAGANRAGHAGVVFNTLTLLSDHSIAGFLDKNPHVERPSDYPILGSTEELPELGGIEGAVVAISDNVGRAAVSRRLKEKGLKLLTLIHPHAFLTPGVLVGEGTFIGPGAVINANVRIGNNVIISAGCVVNNDVIIEDGVYVGPGTVVDSRARLREACFIDAGHRIKVDEVVAAGEKR